MAETCAKAFGRYLKTLRERKGLALDDVASLSRSYADPVAKSYLSRVENGIFSLALSKMIPLCRIYEIPTEALVERLELDLELDKVGAPDTTGMTFTSMLRRGKAAYERGLRWHAYAYYRDATAVAGVPDTEEPLCEFDQRVYYSQLATSTAADNLGRYRFALHELVSLQRMGKLNPKLSALLFDRLAAVQLHSDDLSSAAESADAAIHIATSNGFQDVLGFLYSDRAAISRRQGEFNTAIEFHQKALEAFKCANREVECSRSLHALAIAYFHAARHSAARRALEASERLATKHDQKRLLGLIRLLLGDLEQHAGNHRKASAHWQDVVGIAKGLNDEDLLFQATYYLFCLARDSGDQVHARSLQKALVRMASSIRSNIPELVQFRANGVAQ